MAKRIIVSIPGHGTKLLSIFLNTMHSSLSQINDIKKDKLLFKRFCDERIYYRDERRNKDSVLNGSTLHNYFFVKLLFSRLQKKGPSVETD
jgi:hypothetical protein